MSSTIKQEGKFTQRSQIIDTYKRRQKTFKEATIKAESRLVLMSTLRLINFLLVIYLVYLSIKHGEWWWIVFSIIVAAVFFILIRLYDRLKQRKAFFEAMTALNKTEVAFLEESLIPFADGIEYINPEHRYSYDLDLFGRGGLYPFLNRCSTTFGKDSLAHLLLDPNEKEIAERQEAIIELRDKLEFRQELQAHGSLLDTKEKELKQLKAWLASPNKFTRSIYQGLLFFPVATIGVLIAYFVNDSDRLLNLFYALFVLNLVVTGFFTRRINAQLSVSTSVTNILQKFAGQLSQIEAQGFKSALLKKIQAQLNTANIKSSEAIFKLSSLFNYLETVVNLVVSLLLNGLFLFHIHILYGLEKWKGKYSSTVLTWLQLLGEIEALNSLANFSFNNPDFTKPELSSKETIEVTELGHPLISATKRVCNSISYSNQRFVILTGSNMSGKSTFLRTLGINMVLARSGAAVCAEKFVFYPFKINVSMRITDSLQDSESFFYAELKRLKGITASLESGEKCFIILDEILRGTNSNDKQRGTIGLIRKLIAANAIGIIATHDLTVAKLTDEQSSYLSNRCFESEIINDELVFDYRLKEGVCSHLSASFLMKKMGIIDDSRIN